METEAIIHDLARRFAEPLPEFYKRRIIVWKDEDREFIDKLDEIQIEGVKVIALTGSNNFAVKKLLNKDDTESDYLVYCPIAYESQEDNWLHGRAADRRSPQRIQEIQQIHGRPIAPEQGCVAVRTSKTVAVAGGNHGGACRRKGSQAECRHQSRIAERSERGGKRGLSGIC